MMKIFIVLILLFCFVSQSTAKCVEKSRVKYKTNTGWSKNYYVDVTFMSGSELNTATNSYKYAGAGYAIIFWSQEQVTIIKLNMLHFAGEMSCSFVNGLFDIKGVDQDGDEWDICANSDYVFCD